MDLSQLSPEEGIEYRRYLSMKQLSIMESETKLVPMLQQEQLHAIMAGGCGNPNCPEPNCLENEMFLRSSCHPEGKLIMRYIKATGGIDMFCGTCKAHVMSVEVASALAVSIIRGLTKDLKGVTGMTGSTPAALAAEQYLKNREVPEAKESI
jgi:hypothetical protein